MHDRKSLCLWMVLVHLLSIVTLVSAATPRVMVSFNRKGRGPSRDPSVYDVKVHHYTPKTMDASFCTRLAEAQILYIGQYAGDATGPAIFADPERSAAVRALLERGGMLFVDYAANSGDGPTRKFFAGLGLAHPGTPTGKNYRCVAAPDSRSPLLTRPNKLAGKKGRSALNGYGAWENWPAAWDAPFRVARNPKRAAMLVKTSVLGKGTIILSQMPAAFRNKPGTSKQLADNIIALAFGALPGPGRTVAVYDPYTRKDPAANVLYLKNSARVRWHFEDCEFRIPFLLGEPIGMARAAAPIEMRVTLPAGALPESVRVCEAWGTPLPCQVHAADAGSREIGCTFEADLSPHATRLLLLYCGTQPAAPAEAPYGFALTEEEDGFLLRNDKILISLDKKQAALGKIKPTGGNTRNQLAAWGAIGPGRGNWISLSGGGGIHPGGPEKFEAAVLEDGAVRKRVRYTSPKLEVIYTLYAGAPAVFYSVTAKEALNVTRFTGWTPYGDGDRDALYYEANEGLKNLRLQGGTFYRPYGEIGRFLKEGWLAIADARGEVGGEFADRALLRTITIGHHQANGETIKAGGKLAAGKPAHGAFIAAEGDHTAVRNAYVAWKNPPELVKGELERRDAAPAPAVPRFGKEFILEVGPFAWFGATSRVRGDEVKAERLLTEIEKAGGNFVNTRMGRASFLSALIPRAHDRGMGIQIRAPVPHKPKPCPVVEKDKYVEAAKRVAELGVDTLYLLDEYEFSGRCKGCRETFPKIYGMDMPANPDVSKLAEPAHHNFYLYKMNAITDVIRDMTLAARAIKPDIFTFQVTSPNNHFRLTGYHDLETQSEYLTTTCTDLYSTDLNATKYMMKHVRGTQGNEKPVLIVNGCKWTARDTRINAKHQLLAGANALWHFSFSFMRTCPGVTEANAKVSHWLTRTGMGDMLARSHPVPYLAVFRDRDAFIDSLKRGECSGRLTDYENRIRELCLMRNVPTDILFSKYLSPAELAKYKVLIVPHERVLSDARAEQIADYVRGGGSAIVEGEAVRNPILAALCGVEPADGALADATGLNGTADPLAGIEAEVASKIVPLRTAGAAVLAEANDAPAVTMATAGQGKIACVALTRMPTHIMKRLVRQLGGRRPIELTAELEEKIDTNVLTDGRRYIVAAHNPHYATHRSARLDTAALAAPAGAVAIDFDQGRRAPYNGDVQVELGPTRFAFVAVAAPQDCAMPEAAARSTAGAPAHAPVPGMTFLRIEAPEESRTAEREKDPDKLYVGIFKTQTAPPSALDMGAEAMMNALRQQPGLAPEFIDNDAPATLGFYDVVIVPNMRNRAPNLSEQWQRNLRGYVEKGGGALLVHHSAGYPSTTPPVFPEIASAPDYIPITTMKVADEHPIVNGESMRKRFPKKAADPAFEQYFRATQLTAGQEFVAGFPDYIKLEPGSAGKTLVKSALRGAQGGDPVVVAGRAGKGRVVLSGMNIGCRAVKTAEKRTFEEALTPGELAILVNSVYWLAE